MLVDKEDISNIQIDIKDPRFKAVYETRDYAIDPNSKDYSKKNSSKVLEE